MQDATASEFSGKENNKEDIRIGLVVKVHGKIYHVEDENGNVYEGYMRGKFRIMGLRDTSPVVVGDRVSFRVVNNTAYIIHLFERKNHIVREDSFLRRRVVTAANIDLFLPIYTLKEPYTPIIFLDKLLITAESYDIPSIILFNKIDIYNDEEMSKIKKIADIYERAGYKCLFISALKHIGIEELKDVMKNKISVFVGLSGCGKSTLTNALIPGLNLRTTPVSEKNKLGRHTTTYAALYKMDANTYIADTAGIRIFKISDIEKWELSHYYPEMRKFLGKCKFNNCTHTYEEGCAVIQALKNGEISPIRYENYLKILETETKSKYE